MSRRAIPQSVDLIHPLRAKPFHRDGWIHEEKYDGWRIVAFKDGHRVRLMSRTGRDHAKRFPELVERVAALLAPKLILDGEVCVFDERLVSRLPAHRPRRRAEDRASVHGLRLPVRSWT